MKIRLPDSPRAHLILILAIGGVLVLAVAAVLAIWLCTRRAPTAPASEAEGSPASAETAEKANAPEKGSGQIIRHKDVSAGGVTTMDDRPVDTGYRFRHVRLFPACIAMLLKPAARSVCVVGAEATFFRTPFDAAGLRVLESTNASSSAEIVLVASQPDWLKGTDFPTADGWLRIAGMRAPGGLVALHVDARRLSRGRLKGILSEFRAAVGPYLLWCIGAHDYVVTGAADVSADKMYDLFAGEKASEAFATAGIYTPADVFTCYMGRDVEIEPGLKDVAVAERQTFSWKEVSQSIGTLSDKDAAFVRASVLMPYYIPPMPWFKRGDAEPVVFAGTTNAIAAVQTARREFLAGFDDIGKGISTNALERWAAAATVSPRDPVLRGLVDVIDLKGQQFLKAGNVKGAIGCYEKLLLICPNDAARVHNYGVCLKRGGQIVMAAQVFARAVELDPETDAHRMELVECCAASGHEDVAVQNLDLLIKRHPDDPALKLRAAKLLCMPKGKVRDAKRAIRLAEEAAVQTGWKDRAYVFELANVYIECGRVKDGVRLKRKMKDMKFDR